MQQNTSNDKIDNYTESRITCFDKIIYCKAEGNYTRIYFQDKSILLTKILKCYESILPCETFIRVHKSYIVNINYILSLKGNKRLVLKTNIELPVSRRRRSNIIKVISKSHLIVKIKE